MENPRAAYTRLKKRKLTPQQELVYKYIKSEPNVGVTQIQKAFGFKSNTSVYQYLRQLSKKGYVKFGREGIKAIK